jgi:uncharacterized protein (TIGR02996 family)
VPTPDDERALLAAIVADPADDTVRLAYADCIEERGNAPRAAFIRTQVEAEHHHIDSPRRAALDQRARELFSAHWIEWWTEVCEALGLVVPAPRPTTRLGRIAGAAGFRTPPGTPYSTGASESGLFIYQSIYRRGHTQGFHHATWHRGFPEDVNFTAHHYQPGSAEPLLTRWTTAAPLTAIHGAQPLDEHWYDGPHLCGVRSLTLHNPVAECLSALFQSPYLPRLDEVHVWPDWSHARRVLELSRPHQIMRLTCGAIGTLADVVPDFVDCPRLAELRSLTVVTESVGLLTALARSPYLTGLRELAITLFSQPSLDDCRALTSSAGLRDLRTLTFRVHADLNYQGLDVELLEALVADASLPQLEELRLGTLQLNQAATAALSISPLLKQLKHLAFAARGVVTDADLRRLPEMFDLDRIETFAFSTDRHRPGLDELARVLGERLRLPNAR